MFLLISEVLAFLKATPNTRNFVEGVCITQVCIILSNLIVTYFLGERILNSGNLITCGVLERLRSVSVFSLCLTSKLTAAPHEIKGTFNITKTVKIVQMECSCAAGLGAACKHIAAVLLYCTRLYFLHKIWFINHPMRLNIILQKNN